MVEKNKKKSRKNKKKILRIFIFWFLFGFFCYLVPVWPRFEIVFRHEFSKVPFLRTVSRYQLRNRIREIELMILTSNSVDQERITYTQQLLPKLF